MRDSLAPVNQTNPSQHSFELATGKARRSFLDCYVRDCETEIGNIFNQTNAISKWKKDRITRLASNESIFNGL